MIHWRTLAAGLLAWAGACGGLDAAEYSLTAEVAEVLNADLTPSGLPASPLAADAGVVRVYRIDITLHAGGFDAEEDQRGFGNIVFDITLSGPNLQPHASLDPIWRASDEQTPDLNGEAVGGVLPVWDANVDAGTANDLQFILASIDVIPAPVAEDPRPHLGEGAGTLLGSIYVDWNGVGLASISVTPVTTINGPEVSFARISNGQLVRDESASVFGDMLGLFASADFQEDGDVDAADLAVWTGNYGANEPATHGQGDATGDGLVDGADFLVWQRQYQGESPEVRSVPEGASAGLALMAAAGIGLVRRASRRGVVVP